MKITAALLVTDKNRSFTAFTGGNPLRMFHWKRFTHRPITTWFIMSDGSNSGPSGEEVETAVAADENFEEECSVSDTLLNELECPVCLDYMVPPIQVCENGHNICEQCRPKLTACPSCRRPFLHTRNVALETIAETLQYPCRNRLSGCLEVFPMEHILTHQLTCPFRPYDCPLKQAERCKWKGPYDVITKHVLESHERLVSRTHDLSNVLENLTFNPGYTRVILAYDEIFLHRCRMQKDKFFSAVQYVGPTEKATKYAYEMHLIAEDGIKKIVFCNRIFSDKEDLQVLNNAGNCVRLDYDVIRRFMYDNNLPFKMKILKVASTPCFENDASVFNIRLRNGE